MARPSGLRGLVATRDIAEGEAIISLPIAASIELVGDSEAADPSKAALAMLRLYQAGKDAGGSDLTPYFDLIPPLDSLDMATMPDFFTDEELKMLQCPPVAEKTRRRQELCDRRAAELGLLPADVRWALCTVAQRSFTVHSPFDGLLRLLLPGIDLFNHCAEAPHRMVVRWQLQGLIDGTFKVVAGSAISKGEEIFICYGGNPYRAEGCGGDCVGDLAWTNEQYIQRYGFVCTSIGTLMTDGKWLASEEAAPVREALASTDVVEDEAMLAGDSLTSAAQMAIQFRLRLKRALAAQQQADAASQPKVNGGSKDGGGAGDSAVDTSATTKGAA